MNNKILIAHSMESELVVNLVSRLGTGKYTVAEVPDEVLSRRQLAILLNKALGVPIEEIAFALDEFNHNKSYTQAYFGLINKAFLFAK